MEIFMAHVHDVKKIKSNSNAELASTDAGVVTFVNVSGRNVSVGNPSVLLYPGNTGVACACHPAVLDGVKSKKYKIVSQSDPAPAPKSKKAKAEEPQPEPETFTTVAEPEPSPSVQLDSSEESETPSGDEF
jgi:hypothetical protein